tara:strand:+ start:342 stop:1787 length:1446 start_codon:yes stop_codon:yes gene_type:complete
MTADDGALPPSSNGKVHSENEAEKNAFDGLEEDLETIEENHEMKVAQASDVTIVVDDEDENERLRDTGTEEEGMPGSRDENVDDELLKEWPSVMADGFGPYLQRSLKEIFLGSKLNILLLFIPLAFASRFISWTSNEKHREAATFVFSMLALCPLAERISFVTEDLAKYTNDTIGGLMNASMGNVPELIMSGVALGQDKLRVVQLSLLGSILSNLLLVLGCAFALGGTRLKTQNYNKSAATTNSAILMLMVFALLMPATLSATNTETSENDIIYLSRMVSITLLCVYGGLIYYQLKTHTHLFEGGEEEGDEPPILGIGGSIFWMAVCALLIATLSEFTISAIESTAVTLGISQVFIAAILLPIVGNAAEHAAAIIFAIRNRMEISLGIAVGSSAQISMFVIPALVLIAWPMGHDLSLDFHIFETALMAMTIIVVGFVIQHGESDWLKGLVLLSAYLIAAMSFWFHSDPELDVQSGERLLPF